jgi:hypothetical protein
MRDWQRHQHLLHLHDNAKFARPTPRQTDAPPDGCDRCPLMAFCMVITTACVLGVIGVLCFVK